MSKIVKKIKKVKQSYPCCNLHVISSQNNTKLYATSTDGNLICWATAGTAGFSGAKRSTPHAATEAALAITEKLKTEYKVEFINIIFKYIAPGRDPVFRVINSNFKIKSMIDKTPIQHGGCRAPGRRRV